jgi:arylsulfatase A-like enzyme
LIETSLARLTLGHWVLGSALDVAWYLTLGAATGFFVHAALRVVGLHWRAPQVLGVSLALLQLPAFFQRVVQGLHLVMPSALACIAGGLLAVTVFAAAIAAVQRIAARAPDGFAAGAVALAVALGLALNRNLFGSFVEVPALLADAAVGTLTLAVALGFRASTPRMRLGVGLCAAAATGLLLGALPGERSGIEAPRPVETSATRRNPHLVLLVVDTLREDVLRAVLAETEEGSGFRSALGGATWFSQAIAAAPWTVPSMGSIMTGLEPQEHGFERDGESGEFALRTLPSAVTTLAEKLQARGYHTHAFNTNEFLRAGSGMEQGFARFETLRGATFRLPLLSVAESLHVLPPEPFQSAESVHALLGQRLPELAASGRPLFLWVHLMDAHAPLPRHRDLSSDPAAAALPELERLYRDAVRYALREATQMLGTLEGSGILSEAVVVFTSDHGEMFPSDRRRLAVANDSGHTTYGHGHALYDELLRVPLAIRLPHDGSRERESDALVTQVDLHATLADLLELEPAPSGGRTVSLVPSLRGESRLEADDERTFSLAGSVAYGPEQRVFRERSLKLIEYPNGERQAELYDLASDPREQFDLVASQPKRAQAAALQLAERYAALRLAARRATLPPDAQAQRSGFDDATRRRLQALGYVE